MTSDQIVSALLSAARSAVSATLGERAQVMWPMLEGEARQAAEEAASELAALLVAPGPPPARAAETKKEVRKPDVSVAQAARRDALLDARVNHNGATKTWRGLVEAGIRRGGELGVTFRTSPDLTRAAFNRMGSAEHDAWEEKQKEKGLKPVFRVGTDEDGTFVEVNKTVFEYAMGLSRKPVLVRYDFGYLDVDGTARAAAKEATRREHESLLRAVDKHNEAQSERPEVRL